MSGADFLLELLSEEIPARMQAGARADLERLFRAEMDAAGVAVGEVTVWSTPRRLALVAKGLPEATEAVSEEAKGPPEGAPDAAIDGFCRKAGVTRESLELRDVKGRNTYFAVIDKPGRATREVLAEVIPAIVRAFPWPKSMRWGEASLSTESLRWIRPLSGIVALLGDEVVECEVHGMRAGRETAGHRFQKIRKRDPKSRNFGLPIEIFKDKNPTVLNENGMIEIDNAGEYERRLFDAQVIVNQGLREDEIRWGAKAAANGASLTLVEDEGLVIENAGLTEWPVPLLGRFDEAFLDVPPEVIQLTARTNQKYFVCNDSAGKLANAFVCTANIEAADGGAAIVDGNRKVLAARLSDARFFWEQDRKTSLEDHAKKLERITFHEKLGTVADKVERVAKLARWLVEEGIILPGTGRGTASEARGGGAPAAGETSQGSANPLVPLHHPADGPPPPVGEDRAALADLAEQAARLAKADLVTEMVGEFPELQGLMGGYYARAEGLPDAVADAIRDHYKPVGQGDEVPTAPVTVAVSLADKLDTAISMFAVDELPTGSKDPFALRRAFLGVSSLIDMNELRVPLEQVVSMIGEMLFERFAVATTPYQVTDPWFAFQHDFTFDESDPKLDTYFSDLPFDHEGFVPPSSEKEAEGRSEYFLVAREKTRARVMSFVSDRLKVQQREAGVRHDLIDAVFALGGEDDLVRLLARVHALQAFMGTEDGANLLAGYKRAANILKKEDWQPAETRIPDNADEDPMENVDDPQMRAIYAARSAEKKTLSYTPEPEEKALIDALDAAEPRAAAAIGTEDFAAAMAALASLRAPIDRFFDSVTVNDADPARRAARLDLLARFRAAVHNVADFSRIEG
ncbi:Glycine--tRNA ligase beta subunit [Tsuneonella dongtanensis]|uniref:Glycine--tRNA ligase beta subunit n=1 Tax=Tsuneonella dongtanensis TaxID=692370 RepID=A0A1B2AF85_9SPHN|nr:Glycine--tRNA ligase beta subunit [Tsuneonella dongtanensis]